MFRAWPHRRSFRCTALLGLLALDLGSAAESLAAVGVSEIQPDRVYRVGFERDFPPYSLIDEDGLPTGMIPEMVQAISKVMDMEIEWVAGTAPELRAALERGEIDLLPTVPVSSATEAAFALSLPHTSIEDGVFVRGEAAGTTKGLSSLSECQNKDQKIVFLEKDPALEFLQDGETTFEVRIEPSVADALRSLAAGNADCALLPLKTGLLLSRELELKNIRLLPTRIDFYDRLLAFAARKDQQELLDKLEEGLQIITSDGTYVALFNEWTQYTGRDNDFARRLGWLLIPVAVIALFAVIWTSLLRREVARRTAELHRSEAEKREVESRIAEAQKLESLTLLAGGVAHDFNNLLSAMLGNTSLALYQSSPDSPIAERLREVQKAGRRAADLCQQMLAYSGRGRFVIGRLDLSQVVEDMAGLLQSNVSKKVELIKRLAADLPKVEADEGQLRQVLMNLVVNASEALEDQSGVVEIRTGVYDGDIQLEDLGGDKMPLGTYAFLEVRDNGIGMDEATQRRIFEPFFTTKFMGRGLGLAATLGIVRGHRGVLQVESRPGQGTTFRIFFPASSNQEASSTAIPAPTAAAAGTDETAAAAASPIPESIARAAMPEALERVESPR